MKNLLVLLTCTLLFPSCLEKINIIDPLSDFSRNETLTSEVIPLPEDSLGIVISIDLIDTILILSDKRNDFLFAFYDIKNNKWLGRFGTVGKGPCEVTFPSLISNGFNSLNSLGVFVRNQSKYLNINFNNVAENRVDYYCIDERKLREKGISRSIEMKDSSLICVGLFDHRYLIINRNGQNEGASMEYPFQKYLEDIPTQLLSLSYQSNIERRPSDNTFVTSTINSANFEICEYIGGKIKLRKQINMAPIELDMNNSSHGDILFSAFKQEHKMGFNCMAVSNDYIFMVYNNRSYKQSMTSSMSNYGRDLLVYDWDANPILHASLENDIKDIAVSADNKQLFCLTIDYETGIYIVLTYDLPLD